MDDKVKGRADDDQNVHHRHVHAPGQNGHPHAKATVASIENPPLIGVGMERTKQEQEDQRQPNRAIRQVDPSYPAEKAAECKTGRRNKGRKVAFNA